MMFAAENGQLSCLELLIQNGAYIEAKDEVSSSMLILQAYINLA